VSPAVGDRSVTAGHTWRARSRRGEVDRNRAPVSTVLNAKVNESCVASPPLYSWRMDLRRETHGGLS
jgi:hypothetical protein